MRKQQPSVSATTTTNNTRWMNRIVCMMLALLASCTTRSTTALRRTAFVSSSLLSHRRIGRSTSTPWTPSRLASTSSSSHTDDTLNTSDESTTTSTQSPRVAPWAAPQVKERVYKKRRQNKTRFRQHVNPLARQYQQPTPLPDQWPATVYDQPSLPLHLDIGCSKGGFLIDLAQHETQNRSYPALYNYLGLEIRPMVAEFARNRIQIHNLTGILEFVGCNANVDLARILTLYQEQHDRAQKGPSSSSSSSFPLHRVTIQFPDPHFKNAHAKRRVVREELVDTLAQFMPGDGLVFLQSDVQPVLDSMREVFGNCTQYFRDAHPNQPDYYMPENILGVPTEREVSVIDRDLPVYRSVFYRTDTPWEPPTEPLQKNMEEDDDDDPESLEDPEAS